MHLFLALGTVSHMFYVEVVRILKFTRSFSPFSLNGEVCTVVGSGCSFRSSLARTWKSGHHHYELKYLAKQKMDGV